MATGLRTKVACARKKGPSNLVVVVQVAGQGSREREWDVSGWVTETYSITASVESGGSEVIGQAGTGVVPPRWAELWAGFASEIK
jgi:hypothetical protein